MISLIGRGRWSGLPREAAPLAEAVADALAALRGPEEEGARGLWVATPDGGAEAAIALWAEAVAQGPAFASPGGFPWTLTSALGGHVARRLGLRGPNTTLVGEAEASAAALGFALDALEEGEVARALVLRVEAGRGLAWALALGQGPGPRLERLRAAGALQEDPLVSLASLADPIGPTWALPPWGGVRLRAWPPA